MLKDKPNDVPIVEQEQIRPIDVPKISETKRLEYQEAFRKLATIVGYTIRGLKVTMQQSVWIKFEIKHQGETPYQRWHKVNRRWR